MTDVVLLDAGPLSMITHPRRHPEIKTWLQDRVRSGSSVLVPEIADYELRRELIRSRKPQSVQRLDRLKLELGYVPITTSVMIQAAQYWAEVRLQGRPTAENAALDADMILAAQAWELSAQFPTVIIATTNVGHLSRVADARLWEESL